MVKDIRINIDGDENERVNVTVNGQSVGTTGENSGSDRSGPSHCSDEDGNGSAGQIYLATHRRHGKKTDADHRQAKNELRKHMNRIKGQISILSDNSPANPSDRHVYRFQAQPGILPQLLAGAHHDVIIEEEHYNYPSDGAEPLTTRLVGEDTEEISEDIVGASAFLSLESSSTWPFWWNGENITEKAVSSVTGEVKFTPKVGDCIEQLSCVPWSKYWGMFFRTINRTRTVLPALRRADH